jgi:hypothetical protein
VTDAPGTSAGSKRGQLLSVKLRALVGDHLGRSLDVAPESFNGGAALLVDRQAWVLIDGDAERALGLALAWARRREATSIDVIADNSTGVLARRAAGFTIPVAAWSPVERTLVPAMVDGLPVPPEPSSRHLALRHVIDGAGAQLVVEHGVVTGEVRGLEVCRVVDTPTSGYFDEADGGEPLSVAARRIELDDRDRSRIDGTGAGSGTAADNEVQVEVGVGGPDREAFRIIHGDIPTVEALAGVVQTVERHRGVGAPPHPLNRLAPERFLRWRIGQDPGTIGFAAVESAGPPVARRGLNEVSPCVAHGLDAAGREHAIVLSVGVDLDLMPYVTDVQTRSGLPVVVVLPTRDLLPITAQLAELLVQPIRFATVD